MKQVSQGGVQQMIAYQHIQRRCQADCYSAWRSGGSRLKEQPRPGAWRLMCVCVCVARQSVWVHRKPIETPAGYDCQPLIKQEKNISGLRHIWPPWKGQCVFFLFFFFFIGWTIFFLSSLHFLFLLNTCHFYHPVNEPNKIKHIKKVVVHSDHFYYKKNVGSRRKNRLKTKKAPVQTGNSCLSDWPTATTSGLKHFTIYHARRAAGNTCGKKIIKGNTSPQHNIAKHLR